MGKRARLAKLSRPRLHDALPRERLFRLLDEKRKHPAVWVCGPPGAGKTTLVASYLEAAKLGSVWYQADAGDLDPATFCYFLGQALPHSRGRRRPLPLLTPEYLPDLENFGRRYFRELFARLAADSLVVVDNFQELAGSDTERLLVQSVDQVPDGANILFVSRGEPPNSFARHLAGALAVIDWPDLRLAPEEAADIAARADIDQSLASHAIAQCDGWAAGLTLILERARRSGVLGVTIDSESKEDVFAYFANQYFDQATPREQATLMQIAVLPSMSAPLAIALSGDPDAGRLLEHLYHRQLFTNRRGREDPRYQFHSLFQQFLLDRLRTTCLETEFRDLAKRAARLLEEAAFAEDAFALYGRAGDWEAARSIILRKAETLLAQGRWKTLEQWLSTMPDELVRDDPWLCYWWGAARMQVDLPGARSVLLPAFELFKAARDTIGQLLVAALVVETIYYEYNDFTPLDYWIDEIDRLLGSVTEFPDLRSDLAVHSAMLLATMVRRPAHPMLPRCIDRVEGLLDQSLDVNQILQSAVALLHYFSYAAEFERARPLIRRITPMVSDPSLSALNRAWWWLFLGFHYHTKGDVEASSAAFDAADRTSEEFGLRQPEYLSRTFRVYMYRCANDLESSERWLKLAESALDTRRRMQVAQFHLAAQGNLVLRDEGQLAAHHARLAMNAMRGIGSQVHLVMWYFVGSVALIAGGEYSTADSWLDEGWELTSGTYLEVFRAAYLMVRAASALRQGEKARCRELMKRSLELARTGNGSYYYRWVLRFREPLMAAAIEAGINVPYVTSLVRNFDFRPPDPVMRAWPWPVRITTLGNFGVEVDGSPLAFSRKAPKKPLALLKAVIAFGGGKVPEKRLLDALWPEEDGDAAAEAFRVAVHRLRKLLGDVELVEVDGGALSLNFSHCWIDTRAFEHAVESTADEETDTPSAYTDRVLQLYKGHFLPADEEAPWAISTRERLRSKFVAYVARQGKRLETSGRHDLAAEYYRRGIEADELAEEFYQGLMRCHLQAGGVSDAMNVYRRLRQTLSVTLGIHPSPASQKLFQSLRQ